jgi:hypothetical protein
MLFAYSPLPSQRFTTSAQNVYLSDSVGIIRNVLTLADLRDLVAMGCASLQPSLGDLLFTLSGANFNTTADQQFTPNFNGKCRLKRIVALNTSVNGMSTAAGGVYTAASKGGSAIVAAGQVYTGLTNALTALELTIALPNLVLAAGTPLILSLTTPQGGTATADLYGFGDLYT